MGSLRLPENKFILELKILKMTSAENCRRFIQKLITSETTSAMPKCAQSIRSLVQLLLDEEITSEEFLGAVELELGGVTFSKFSITKMLNYTVPILRDEILTGASLERCIWVTENGKVILAANWTTERYRTTVQMEIVKMINKINTILNGSLGGVSIKSATVEWEGEIFESSRFGADYKKRLAALMSKIEEYQSFVKTIPKMKYVYFADSLLDDLEAYMNEAKAPCICPSTNCSICLCARLQDSTALSCGHVFCSPCLQKLFRRQNPLKCPDEMCQKRTSKHEARILKFPQN